MSLTIIFPQSIPAPFVPTVRKWVIPEDGMSTVDLAVGSFTEVPLYSRSLHWGAISQWQSLDAEAEEFLKFIQPADGWTLAQKWVWLANDPQEGTPTRPYWRPAGKPLRYGTMVYGGQKVSVKQEAGKPLTTVINDRYRNTTTIEPITFYHLDGLTRAEMRAYRSNPTPQAFQRLFDLGKIQRCTQMNKTPRENSYSDLTKGIIYHPVWSPVDWPANSGSELLLARAFCE